MPPRRLSTVVVLELLYWVPLSYLPYIVRGITGQHLHSNEPFVSAFVPLILIYLLARTGRWQVPLRAGLLVVLTVGATIAVGLALARMGAPRPDVLLALVDTNMAESREFLARFYTWRSYLVVAILIIPSIAFVWQWRQQAFWRPRPSFGVVLIALFAAQLALLPDRVGLTGNNLTGLAVGRIENLYPFGIYPPARPWVQLGQALRLRARMTHPDDGAVAALAPGIRVLAPPAGPRTYVLVITESVARSHMGIYGYQRGTTPRLSALAARGDLAVFTDAVTSQAQTALALFDALSWTSPSQPNPRSVVNLFNAAGFETTWISNQPGMGLLDSVSSLLAAGATHLAFPNHPAVVAPDDPGLFAEPDRAVNERYRANFDDRVLPELAATLRGPARDKFIVIHLMGSHSLYQARYPVSATFFTSASRPNLTAAQNSRVNAYDDSIRFGDGVIADIIDAVGQQPGESFVLTLSDHGQEVYDFRDFAGHTNSLLSPWMLEIPLVIWLSPEYRAHHESLAAAVLADTARPYVHRNLPATLADLARIGYADLANASLFAPDSVATPRIVDQQRYDEFMRTWAPDAAHAAGIALLPGKR